MTMSAFQSCEVSINFSSCFLVEVQWNFTLKHCFISTNQNNRPIIGIMQSSMAVDFPDRLDEHDHDLCTNITQKRRGVRFSLSSTLYYNPDVLEDEVASSWYTSEEEQRFKQMARQEIAWFIKMIEDSRYVGVRLKHGMSPVGIEQALLSRSHTEKRVISKRLVSYAPFSTSKPDWFPAKTITKESPSRQCNIQSGQELKRK